MRRLLALACLLSGACSHVELRDATEPEVGCDADAIEILGTRGTGIVNQGGPQSWTARCEGVDYFCSRLHRQTICTTVPEGFDPNASGQTPPQDANE